MAGYSVPACPTSNCRICYHVTNQGGYGGSGVGGVGNSVVVQIIDSCPAAHAENFCKTDVPADQRCGAGTNTLDIDQSAYHALTGQGFGSVSCSFPGLRRLPEKTELMMGIIGT